MKLYTFSLFLILSLAFSIGCGTENPLCTDSFCIVPRDAVEGEVIEVDETKVLALIAKTTEVDQPPITPVAPPTDVSLSDIVASAARGSTQYVGQTVTIQGTVRFNFVDDGLGSITLQTNNDLVSFFVTAYPNPETLRHYIEGNSYTFTLFIRGIRESETNPDKTNIWSHETEE